MDAGLVLASKRPVQRLVDRETGEERDVDFGHVGDIESVQPALLLHLLERGYLPVIASLGVSRKGEILNINADTIASEIAIALQADKLILLSNTDGIYRDLHDPQTRIPRLSLQEAETLYSSQSIGAGMLPKLKSILSLLERGVQKRPPDQWFATNALLQDLTEEGSGTTIHR